MDSLVDLYVDWMEWPLIQEYYGFSGFLNAGYWSEGTRSQQQACEDLSDKLLSLLPHMEGNILDVACGNGATTRALLRHYPAAAVVGINISQRQLERCRQTAAGCTFLEMNAVDLQFEAETFNTVICTEAAFHFRTRRDFFREAFRVLKPGGHLLLADIVFGTKNDVSDFIIPGANTVADVDDYRAQLAEASFDSICVLDATLACWTRYTQNLKRWLMAKKIVGELRSEDEVRLQQNPFSITADYWYYLLAAAHKPA